MQNSTCADTLNTQDSGGQQVGLVDSLLGSVGYSSDNVSVTEFRNNRLENLEKSGKAFHSIGEKARLKFWAVMIDIYIDRDFLFVSDELKPYRRAFSKYMQKYYDVPKSSADADARIIKMLEQGGRRNVLEQPMGKLNTYLRAISKAKKDWHGALIEDIEKLSKVSVEDLIKGYEASKADSANTSDEVSTSETEEGTNGRTTEPEETSKESVTDAA
jgi:hypothetical protein